MGKIGVAAAVAASILVVAAPAVASAGVLVVGKSLAGSCSTSAIAGASHRRALDTCNRALAEQALNERDRAATHINRGVILVRRGEFDAAMGDFEIAVATKPDLGEAWVNRGSIHLREGRLEEGVADTDRGLALGLRQPERAYFNRALAKEWLADTKGAYLDYRRAAELNPNWTEPREQLARFTVVSNTR